VSCQLCHLRFPACLPQHHFHNSSCPTNKTHYHYVTIQQIIFLHILCLPNAYKTVAFADLLGTAHFVAASGLHANNDVHISYRTFRPLIRNHVVCVFQQLPSQSEALENLDSCFCLQAFRFVLSFYVLHFPKVSSFYLQICNFSYLQFLPAHLPALSVFQSPSLRIRTWLTQIPLSPPHSSISCISLCYISEFKQSLSDTLFSYLTRKISLFGGRAVSKSAKHRHVPPIFSLKFLPSFP